MDKNCDDQRQLYVRRVLSRYCLTHSAFGLVRPADRTFANQLFDQQVPMAAVEAAFAIVSLRSELSPPSAPQPRPIRSLRYFKPIIERLRDDKPAPFPAIWLLALRLDALCSNEPPDDLPPW